MHMALILLGLTCGALSWRDTMAQMEGPVIFRRSGAVRTRWPILARSLAILCACGGGAAWVIASSAGESDLGTFAAFLACGTSALTGACNAMTFMLNRGEQALHIRYDAEYRRPHH